MASVDFFVNDTVSRRHYAFSIAKFTMEKNFIFLWRLRRHLASFLCDVVSIKAWVLTFYVLCPRCSPSSPTLPRSLTHTGPDHYGTGPPRHRKGRCLMAHNHHSAVNIPSTLLIPTEQHCGATGSVMLASHMNTGSSPRCSTSDPAPCERAWEGSSRRPAFLGPGTQVRHREGAPGSQLPHGPAPAINVMWGVSQQTEGLSFKSCLSNKHIIKIFKRNIRKQP